MIASRTCRLLSREGSNHLPPVHRFPSSLLSSGMPLMLRQGPFGLGLSNSLGGSIQQVVHHVGVYKAELLMAECLWQRADNRESQRFPQSHRSLVGADDAVELHGNVPGDF